jgi:hypothetical protein
VNAVVCASVDVFKFRSRRERKIREVALPFAHPLRCLSTKCHDCFCIVYLCSPQDTVKFGTADSAAAGVIQVENVPFGQKL